MKLKIYPMKHISKDFSEYIFSLHRYAKRSIAIITDLALCIICTWLAFFLRLEELLLFKEFAYNPKDSAVISVILAIPVFWVFGLYRTIFRYAGLSILFTISISTFVYGLLYFSVIAIYGIQGVPRSIGFIQPMLIFFGIVISRFSLKYILTGTFRRVDYSKNKKNVLIYGAGSAGRQLLTSLENNSEFKIAGFLDDNYLLHRQVLLGQTIFDPAKLKGLVESEDISLVLLAIPSISKIRKNEIIKNLNNYNLVVKSLPNVHDIINNRVTVSDIKDFFIDDLLNREQVDPDYELLKKNVKLKKILVTGAGGSIGSELCRQIIKLKPEKLILVELNEFSLYKVYEELIASNKDIKIIPLLANVQDQAKLEKIFETFGVETIYHAAAYKHVSLVEENICSGVKNNVFGTLSVAKASVNQNVSNLVFISSDKAVRPTNLMGASKRLSELCMQAVHENIKNSNINFSIVRFGNVLESSGSVIPKFRQQIKEGGPVTLSHPDVTRYFMTITEAAQLVIQAGALGKNSEVFVLDMGESVKIRDLIDRMIYLSGLKFKDNKNPDGDIEIKITGLRPGEKLYEELLIGDNPQETIHPKIQTTRDIFISFNQLEKILDDLLILLNNDESLKVKKLLDQILELYKSNSEIVDHLYTEDILSKKNKKEIMSNKKSLSNIIKIK